MQAGAGTRVHSQHATSFSADKVRFRGRRCLVQGSELGLLVWLPCCPPHLPGQGRRKSRSSGLTLLPPAAPP